MSKMDDYIKLLLSKMNDDGISTGQVADGRIFIISRVKLAELLKQVNDNGNEAAIIFIKDPSKVN